MDMQIRKILTTLAVPGVIAGGAAEITHAATVSAERRDHCGHDDNASHDDDLSDNANDNDDAIDRLDTMPQHGLDLSDRIGQRAPAALRSWAEIKGGTLFVGVPLSSLPGFNTCLVSC